MSKHYTVEGFVYYKAKWYVEADSEDEAFEKVKDGEDDDALILGSWDIEPGSLEITDVDDDDEYEEGNEEEADEEEDSEEDTE